MAEGGELGLQEIIVEDTKETIKSIAAREVVAEQTPLLEELATRNITWATKLEKAMIEAQETALNAREVIDKYFELTTDIDEKYFPEMYKFFLSRNVDMETALKLARNYSFIQRNAMFVFFLERQENQGFARHTTKAVEITLHLAHAFRTSTEFSPKDFSLPEKDPERSKAIEILYLQFARLNADVVNLGRSEMTHVFEETIVQTMNAARARQTEAKKLEGLDKDQLRGYARFISNHKQEINSLARGLRAEVITALLLAKWLPQFVKDHAYEYPLLSAEFAKETVELIKDPAADAKSDIDFFFTIKDDKSRQEKICGIDIKSGFIQRPEEPDAEHEYEYGSRLFAAVSMDFEGDDFGSTSRPSRNLRTFLQSEGISVLQILIPPTILDLGYGETNTKPNQGREQRIKNLGAIAALIPAQTNNDIWYQQLASKDRLVHLLAKAAEIRLNNLLVTHKSGINKELNNE